jgi:hypothetical protein
MKHDFESILKKTVSELSLTDAERSHMRYVLREYAAFRRAELKPEHASLLAQFRALVTSRPLALALSAFLVVGVTGAGAAQAADGALPGDPLYSLKVGVVEPLRLSLASAGTKHSLERTFAERRLTEAAELANLDRLSPATEATLAAHFTYYSTRALARAQETASSSPTAEVTAEDFSARLSAYDTVLARIETRRGKDTAKALRTAIHQATLVAASSTDPKENDEESAASSLQFAAEDAFDRSTIVVTSLKSSVPTSTSAHAAKVLEDADELRNQGAKFLKERDTKAASKAFKASLRASTRANILTHAAANFNIDAFDDDSIATSTPEKEEEGREKFDE